MVVYQLFVHGVDSREDSGETEVTGDDAIEHRLDVERENVSVLDDGQAHVGGEVPGQVLVTLVQELHSHGDRSDHDGPLAVVEEDAAHDV